MSTITQDAPVSPEYPPLPSDDVMIKELADARAKHAETRANEIKATFDAVPIVAQSDEPRDVRPFQVDPKQEKHMLPSPKDVEGSLIVAGFDKYAKKVK